MRAEKRRPARRWWRLAAGLAAAALAGWALLNLIVDPFGVFGDRVLGWWDYNETRNPQTAKFTYLEQHHREFDSYVIGGPSAGAWPKEALDRYFGASFYNLALNSADMGAAERFVRYLVTHYEVKNLVLTVTVDSAAAFGPEDRSAPSAPPYQLDGGSPLAHYARYLFASPRYALSKLLRMRSDGVVPNSFDVFDADTGAIDYAARDVEAVGVLGLEGYLAAHPEFSQQPEAPALAGRQSCVESVAVIRDLCDQAGVNLVVVAAPTYSPYLERFSRQEVEEFFAALAETVPYWDFTTSPVSRDPRYFYDPASFRTATAEMMLARIFEDGSAYCPQDFGVRVTQPGGEDRLWDASQPDPSDYTAQVPILMYHHLSEDTISGETLDEQLSALAGAGYTAVTFEDLRAYVERGTDLPDKPVVITFDDGYLSNLETGLPILEKNRMKATIFVIGCSVGKDTYKDTGQPMTPHFTLEQAQALMDSGWVDIGSHGYDIHEVRDRDPDPIRHGVLQREDESEADYVAFLRRDCAQINQLLEPLLGRRADVLAYPYGQCSTLSEIVMAQEGMYVTLTTLPGGNTVVKGIPQTLRAMNRYDMEEFRLTGAELVELLDSL